MARKALALGEHGEIETTAQVYVDGRWISAVNARKAQRHRARAYYRAWDGVRRDVSVIGKTKHAAIKACEVRLSEVLRQGDLTDRTMAKTTPFVTAGRIWIEQISRTDSGLSPRSVSDYRRAFDRYIDRDGSAIRGLTLNQVNDPQRLRLFLQMLADRHGTGSAKLVKTIISNILTLAVNNGVLDTNAIRQLRSVKSQLSKPDPRDRQRASTRTERDDVLAYADKQAAELSLDPRAVRKRQTTADLVAFLAGTGARIEEARAARWDDLNLATGACRIRGTKSKSSDRVVNLPEWLRERLTARRERVGRSGYVFASPAHVSAPERPWDQSNSAGAVRAVLDGSGMTWAVPHTFRRTVASLLHEAGTPIVRIADQLGHADPAMTARVYLGRDFGGDKSDLAAHL